MMPPNEITGANVDGPRKLPIRTRWATRAVQFGQRIERCYPPLETLPTNADQELPTPGQRWMRGNSRGPRQPARVH
jgi:hypothetical protein